MTSNDRVKKLRAKNKKLGRRRKEFYLTDSEHVSLKAKLAELRDKL
jgi:hypothetical protein